MLHLFQTKSSCPVPNPRLPESSWGLTGCPASRNWSVGSVRPVDLEMPDEAGSSGFWFWCQVQGQTTNGLINDLNFVCSIVVFLYQGFIVSTILATGEILTSRVAVLPYQLPTTLVPGKLLKCLCFPDLYKSNFRELPCMPENQQNSTSPSFRTKMSTIFRLQMTRLQKA